MRYIFCPGVRVTLAWVSFGGTLVCAVLFALATSSVDSAILALPKTPQETAFLISGMLWLLLGASAKIVMVEAAKEQAMRKFALATVSALLSLTSLCFDGCFWAIIWWGYEVRSVPTTQLSLVGDIIFFGTFFSMPLVDVYNLVYWVFRRRIGQ